MRTVCLYGLTERRRVQCAERRFRPIVLFGKMDQPASTCSGIDISSSTMTEDEIKKFTLKMGITNLLGFYQQDVEKARTLFQEDNIPQTD